MFLEELFDLVDSITDAGAKLDVGQTYPPPSVGAKLFHGYLQHFSNLQLILVFRKFMHLISLRLHLRPGRFLTYFLFNHGVLHLLCKMQNVKNYRSIFWWDLSVY